MLHCAERGKYVTISALQRSPSFYKGIGHGSFFPRFVPIWKKYEHKNRIVPAHSHPRTHTSYIGNVILLENKH